MFMNAKKGSRSDFASLLLKQFSGIKCLSFWYCMRGKDMGQLKVYVDGNRELLIDGQQGDGWKKAEVKILGFNSEVGSY